MEPTFKAGYESHFHNKGKYQNPYKKGTDEYNSFERGWTQAIKRSEQKHHQTYTGLNDKPKNYLQKDEKTALNAEAYANRKGY